MRLRALGVIVAGLVALAGCTSEPTPPPSSPTPSLTTAPAPTATPTPIEGLPDDHTISPVNGHVAPDSWAFIKTATGDPIGVRINGLWTSPAGSLADRSYSQPPNQTPVDVHDAVPFFLSWSYVVLGGTDDAPPGAIVLPSDTQNVFNVASVFSDHDCPDYQAAVGVHGVGFLVTHCSVTLSLNGAYPIGLAFEVPGASKQYWFLDAPAAQAMPA